VRSESLDYTHHREQNGTMLPATVIIGKETCVPGGERGTEHTKKPILRPPTPRTLLNQEQEGR